MHRIIRLDVRHSGWATFQIARIRLPDGTEYDREIEDHGSAVAVLPYDPERGVSLLVRQFRAAPFHAAGVDSTLECPAGLLDEDDPEAGAKREVEEEVGVTVTTLERVGAVWALPGISTERMHLFLASYGSGDRRGAGGGLAGENERIEVVETPLRDLAAMADDGRLDDMKSLCLVQALRLRHPELFTHE